MSEFEINDFPDIDTFSNETQVLLRWLHRVTQNVADAKAIPEFIISLFGILLNVFHLIILTRKSMRSTSINVLMIGIAFCDLFVMTHAVSSFIYLHMNTECDHPWSYFRTVADVLVFAVKDSFRRVSAWLGVLMAATRLLIIKNPLDPKYNFLNKPSFSWKSISLLIALSSFLLLADESRLHVVELSWTPPEQCRDFPKNFTSNFYFAYIKIGEDGVWFEKTVKFADGISRMIPAILLPILTFSLIRELKTASKARRKLTNTQNTESPQKDRTTKLVILMTVSFMISEGPLGIVYLAESFLGSSRTLVVICSHFWVIFNIFVALNATTHCLICMAMSSQYRTCVKSLFCWKKKSETITMSSKVSVTSVSNVVVTY